MDQLAIQLRDGQPGFIRCDAETVALVKSKPIEWTARRFQVYNDVL
jgi:hypothetical protein